MKKLIVLLSAVALIGLTACSQEQLGPKNEGSKKEVKTNFSFNISQAPSATKATAATVQDGTDFRGMSDMTLFVATEDITADGSNGDFIPNYKYELGTLGAGEITADQSNKIYSLSIPLGVNNMTFYGRATKTGSDAAEGALVWPTNATKKADVNFAGKAILPDPTDFNATADDLAEILNDVISAKATIDGTEVTWASLATSTDAVLIPLKDAYKELTTIQTGEFRDGSGFGVNRMMSDLYKVVSKVSSAAGKPIADAIKAKIEQYFTADTEGNLTYKTADLAKFPASFDVPNGTAQLTFESGAFKYVTAPESFGAASSAVAAVSNFMYPLELTYWVNSPIRVTSQEVTEADYPHTPSTWQPLSNAWDRTKWPREGMNGTVASDTRAVALQSNINYGVSLLKTLVKYNAATITDNRKAILDRKAAEQGGTNTEEDKEITVSDDSFQLKGILVGNQPAQVGWDFVAPAGEFKNVIYDKTFDTDVIPASGESDPFYTLVFDDLNATNKPVNIALELVNNTGEDFYGRDNIIPAGGTFYLVGTLDPNLWMGGVGTGNVVITFITSMINKVLQGQRIPPYYDPSVDPQNLQAFWDAYARPFIQDFTTQVTFTITNLHGAYATVPDLQSVEMTFGLSVDLEWATGLKFGVELK